MRLNPKPLPPPQLSEKIVRDLQAEIDAFIDLKTAEVAKDCPGVPFLICRNIITARSPDCQCRQYLRLIEENQ